MVSNTREIISNVRILKSPAKEWETSKDLKSPLPIVLIASLPMVPSTAILIYLSSKYPVADHWYPADLQARAQIHEYLGWHADNIRGTFGVLLWTKVSGVLWGGPEPWAPGKSQAYTLLFCQVLGPLIGVQVPEEKVERNKNSMVPALQRLEDKFLRDRAFLVGQQVTLADLMCLEELLQV